MTRLYDTTKSPTLKYNMNLKIGRISEQKRAL